jgi:flavodoxin
MNRRTLMKGSITLGAGAVLSAQLASCSPPPAPRPATSPEVAPEPSTAPAPSKMLVACFSRAGENYYYGDRINLEVGNTEVVANMIASTLSADVYRINAADPYPASYDATVERNVREQDSDARPAIAGGLPAVETYDTVLLGSPIWNVRPPMIMRTFIDSVDLRGKTILPFVKKKPTPSAALATPSTTTHDSAQNRRSAKASPCAAKRLTTRAPLWRTG